VILNTKKPGISLPGQLSFHEMSCCQEPIVHEAVVTIFMGFYWVFIDTSCRVTNCSSLEVVYEAFLDEEIRIDKQADLNWGSRWSSGLMRYDQSVYSRLGGRWFESTSMNGAERKRRVTERNGRVRKRASSHSSSSSADDGDFCRRLWLDSNHRSHVY
jgi:hypothetical protein